MRLSNTDFVRVFKALSKGKINDGHVALLVLLGMLVPSSVTREEKDNSIKVIGIAKATNSHPTTVVKRIKFLVSEGVIEIGQKNIRSDSRISVSKICCDRLLSIGATDRKKRGNAKTEEIKETIRRIKSLLPGVKRNFSTHPKFYTSLWNVIDTGVNIDDFVKWTNRNYKYFSLGLFCSSFTFQKFQEHQKIERYKHPEKEFRRENERDEASFWRKE